MFSRRHFVLFLAQLLLVASSFAGPCDIDGYGKLGKKRIAPKFLEQADLDADYRLYLLDPGKITPAENPEIKGIPLAEYRLKATYKGRRAGLQSPPVFWDPQYPLGRARTYSIVESQDGIVFSVPEEVFANHAGPDLKENLDRIAALVRNKKTRPELDGLFSSSHQIIDADGVINYGEHFFQAQADLEAQILKEDGIRTHVEAFPLEIFGTHGLDSTKYLVKTSKTYDTTVVETIDTVLLKNQPEWAFPYEFYSEKDRQMFFKQKKSGPIKNTDNYTFDIARPSGDPSLEARGRAKQTSYLDELLNFVFPLYKSRRGWSDDFIAELRAHAHQTSDSTRYLVVRKKLPDGSPGEIMATLGLNRAQYSRVNFFDKKSGRWMEFTGKTGRREDVDPATINSLAYSLPLWSQAVPRLGMEDHFKPNEFLPRPGVVEKFDRFAVSDNAVISNWLKAQGVDADPDLSRGVFFSRGQIYEPVKFALAKKEALKGVAYSEIVKDLLGSVFVKTHDADFNLNGQMLYTFNDRSGIGLYSRMGFSPRTGADVPDLGMKDWALLSMSPKTMLDKDRLSKAMSEGEAQKFLEGLDKSLSQLLRPKPQP